MDAYVYVVMTNESVFIAVLASMAAAKTLAEEREGCALEWTDTSDGCALAGGYFISRERVVRASSDQRKENDADRTKHWKMGIEEMHVGQIVCYSAMGLLCEMEIARLIPEQNRVVLTDGWGNTLNLPARLVYRYPPPGNPCKVLSQPTPADIERVRALGVLPHHDVIDEDGEYVEREGKQSGSDQADDAAED